MTGSKRFGLFGLALLATPALAWGIPFNADLEELNGSGVSGSANMDLNGDSLDVDIDASGLEADQVHPQFIRGVFDEEGNSMDPTIPGADADTDGDGFVEEEIPEEGPANYGEAILPLTSPPGGELENFPTADGDGSISFSQAYDLTNGDIFAGDFSRDDLLPMDQRTVVLHGLTPDGTPGAGTEGEVDGSPGYKAVLPVAAGTIEEGQGGPPEQVPAGPPEEVPAGPPAETPGEGPPAQIPEPGSLSLFAMGALAFLSGFGRRFRKVRL